MGTWRPFDYRPFQRLFYSPKFFPPNTFFPWSPLTLEGNPAQKKRRKEEEN
ncbi:hypothetical protein LR48_Vigan10g095000 [Vigna angularis]|uniref:Uncharacterized protein n=1 Tax=Phaseolus angularis TaxID=3914 RepID=A0A0L9VJA5_PHAAN|nr:hypothetical protein LR48_Vigan10g095000 [Vigna angularis]